MKYIISIGFVVIFIGIILSIGFHFILGEYWSNFSMKFLAVPVGAIFSLFYLRFMKRFGRRSNKNIKPSLFRG